MKPLTVIGILAVGLAGVATAVSRASSKNEPKKQLPTALII